MHPHVLFTAHNHKSMIVSTNDQYRNDRLITPITEDNNRIYQYFLGLSELYEILVPTCSYRMGTTKIGYGFAVLGISLICNYRVNKQRTLLFRIRKSAIYSPLVSVPVYTINNLCISCRSRYYLFSRCALFEMYKKRKF